MLKRVRIAVLATLAATLLSAGAISAGAQAAGTLRWALDQDPDVLDPARSGSYGDRIVTNWMCDQLLDVNAKLDFVPGLATSWEWAADNLSLTLHLRPGVVFQDGEKFNAAAVKANIDRYQNDRLSLRKAELKPVIGVETPDDLTVKLLLSRPYAPLLSLLANRPGTMMSPRILGKTGDEIIANPVCSGPYKFVERIAQDRIVLDKFAGHWNAAAMGPDRVVFLSMVDSTIRQVNLQAGNIEIHNRVAPTDVAAVVANPKLKLVSIPGLGFQIISFNINKPPGAASPLGQSALVRQALDKAIDRKALNDVVFEGRFVPSNQTEPPGGRYWNPALAVGERDVEGAKALLRQAGIAHPSFTLFIGTDSVNAQIGQVMQSMAAEAGFDIKLEARDGLSALQSEQRGEFQAAMGIWSGRPDPDGNAAIWYSCNGFLNWGQYCNKDMDAALEAGAALTDPEKRMPFYRKVAAIEAQDRSHMVLFHFTWLWGLNEKVDGVVPMPDGILRPAGVRLKN